jgi:6,7-dimethyl-8-ribityllumazine synthase
LQLSDIRSAPHILIVEARFYEAMSYALLEGAKAALDEAGATYDIVGVPGALEIPAVITFAQIAEEEGGKKYDGYVALGIVIRGETYHFDVVANESSRGLMQISIECGAAIGNGILTVENEEQGWRRARKSDLDKGGFAARAALRMIELKKQFGA